MADEVLRWDAFCPGYVDSIGNWNNGFACPTQELEPMFCCGTATYRYCCPATRDEEVEAVQPSHSLPLILGVVFGTLVSAILVITALCLFWRSWRAYKKRPRRGGQLFCVTGGGVTSLTGGGVASLYTGSLSRHSSRVGSPQQEDGVLLQGVDEVAVTPSCRLSTPITLRLPTSFSAGHGNRALLSESSDISSNSSATDTTMDQLYANIAGRQPPPAYTLNSHLLRSSSLTPPEYATKSGSDFDSSYAEQASYRDHRSRSPSSLFRSTRF